MLVVTGTFMQLWDKDKGWLKQDAQFSNELAGQYFETLMDNGSRPPIYKVDTDCVREMFRL